MEKGTQDANAYGYSVMQNLRDAGCTEDIVEAFMAMEDGRDDAKRMRLLAGHRKRLLEQLRRDERQIDCLDYLIYQMGRRGEQ